MNMMCYTLGPEVLEELFEVLPSDWLTSGRAARLARGMRGMISPRVFANAATVFVVTCRWECNRCGACASVRRLAEVPEI